MHDFKERNTVNVVSFQFKQMLKKDRKINNKVHFAQFSLSKMQNNEIQIATTDDVMTELQLAIDARMTTPLSNKALVIFGRFIRARDLPTFSRLLCHEVDMTSKF